VIESEKKPNQLIWQRRTLFAIALLALAIFIGGCTGFPGAPGANQQAAQQGPPALNPPTGMKSGGARSVFGAAVTAPDDQVLSVNYELANTSIAPKTATIYNGVWHHCRRISFGDSMVIIEGINFDVIKAEGATTPTDVNFMLPLTSVVELNWRYDPAPKSAAKDANAPAGEPNAPATPVAPKGR
jgi:hypothetical protein